AGGRSLWRRCQTARVLPSAVVAEAGNPGCETRTPCPLGTGRMSKRLQSGDDVVGREVALDLAVEDHRRGEAAGSQAAGGEQRDLPVGGGLARADVQAAADAREDAGGAVDVAGGAGAHEPDAPALRR